MTSIVILCCNQIRYTQFGVESLLRFTRSPYELIMVDNASSDETPAYLVSLRQRPGPVRMVVLRNETNLGFAAGCNQALAHAQGEHVVFLNNDTIVTEGWLEGLLRCAEQPGIGLVGPVSNFAPAPQHVAVDYTDPAGIESFAARRRQEFAGQFLKVERLTGFCLLVSRAVLDRLGGLDERFGLGFFEDDDLCIRARQAGFGLAVALDVFIHHFGNRTFQSLGLDAHRQLATNFELFRNKWGDEVTKAYHAPKPVAECASIQPVPQRVQPVPLNAGASSYRSNPMSSRISLCLIVKNGEATLPACLRSAVDLCSETIVVDTGSTDRSKEIAASFGAKVFDFPWCDSFSAARNEALRHGTGEWIFWLDADDYIDEENRGKLRALFERLGAAIQRSAEPRTLVSGETSERSEPIASGSTSEMPLTDVRGSATTGFEANVAYVMRSRSAAVVPGDSPTLVDQCHLFRNHPEIRWSYRVHEQILPAINRLGHAIRFTDICIDHTGYTDPATLAGKRERNLRLLHLEEAEQPDDPFTLFNLGWAYQDAGQPARAVPYLKRSLERVEPSASIVRKLYALLAQSYEKLGQPRDALTWCRAGRVRFPDDGELLFREGALLRGLGDLRGAELAWRSLLEVQPGAHFASLDAGLRGFKTHYHLGLLLRDVGRAEEAIEQWQKAVAERPGFVPAWEQLARVYLDRREWAAFDDAVGHLPGAEESKPLTPNPSPPRGEGSKKDPSLPRGEGSRRTSPPRGEGSMMALTRLVLEARGRLARRDFEHVRKLLDDAIASFPNELPPRIYRSRVLLEEGTDLDAAEAALRDLTERAPRLEEGWRNLALLLRNRGRPADAVTICRAGRQHCPNDGRLMLYEGLFLAEAGDPAGAEPYLLRYLESQPAGGRETVEARHELAKIYLSRGRFSDAEAQWRALLADQPHFAGARQGLAEIHRRKSRLVALQA